MHLQSAKKKRTLNNLKDQKNTRASGFAGGPDSFTLNAGRFSSSLRILRPFPPLPLQQQLPAGLSDGACC